MRKLLGAATVFAVVLAAPTPAFAVSRPHAFGNGATAFQDFSFNARGTPADARGNVMAHIPVGEGPRMLVHGKVDCINVIPGVGDTAHQAILTGPVTNVQRPLEVEGVPPEFFEFDRFYVRVVDVEDEREATADTWNGTFYRRGTLDEELEPLLRDCTANLPFGNPLVEGEIEVRPGSAVGGPLAAAG